jgi:hypothetical protein
LGEGDPIPLSINVGLSRKASRDYQSRGASINVCAELDHSLLARPDELQRQVDDLFAQASAALDRQAGMPGRTAPSLPPSNTGYGESRSTRAHGGPTCNGGNGEAHRGGSRQSPNGNGHPNGIDDGSRAASLTHNQRRAILAIAKRTNVDVDAECRDVVGDKLDNLTLRQASELIDHLKGIEPARNGR